MSGHKVRAAARDKLQIIKDYARRGKFDILLVFMFDRIGRIADETPFVVEWFVRNGIRVWSTQEGEQRFDNHTDKLLNYIRFWQADGESEKTSVRTRTSLRQLVEEGHFKGGNAPYGYDLVRSGRINKRKHELYELHINEQEAAVVRIVFDKYVYEGYGPQHIATYLNNSGYRARSGKCWHPSSIRGMVQNLTYTGVLRCGDQGGNAMRLKNDTNNFAASFNITPPYQMLVLHSKMLIYPRELYQRGVQRKRVEMIAADFNEYVANEPKVSFRNGKYYVVDGQHTIEGRILRNGGKDLPILCKVYTGLTMEQEALFFAEQNGHSAPLTAGIKLRAKVVGGDAPSKAFLAATNRVGLAFNYDSLQLSDYRISCVGTALKLYNQMGEKIYCESLRLIVAAWEGKPDSFRASVLRGVMHFVELYHGEFSEERLIRALGNVHPMEIYRVGRDNPAKLPGWKKYVFPIYMAYNGKGRKDALSMKF